jgi:NitT/TauT family transport system substrate-binding protein
MTSIHPLARRKFNTWLAGLGCLPLIAACSTKDQPVTIGMHVWPGYEPIPLARAMGWLDDKLVKLVDTPAATDSLKLLEQGKIDGAGLTLDEVLRARANGIALAVVLVCDISAGADMLLARPAIKTLSDLRGLRIGVENGALGALMLYKALRSAGLTVADVKPVSLTVNQQAQAWEQGEIDAAITYEPAASQIFALGGNRLFDSRQIPDTILDVLAVRSAVLDPNHSKALRHLVASHLRALH